MFPRLQVLPFDMRLPRCNAISLEFDAGSLRMGGGSAALRAGMTERAGSVHDRRRSTAEFGKVDPHKASELTLQHNACSESVFALQKGVPSA